MIDEKTKNICLATRYAFQAYEIKHFKYEGFLKQSDRRKEWSKFLQKKVDAQLISNYIRNLCLEEFIKLRVSY